MTEKERKAEFNDSRNWFPSIEFPSNGLMRVMCFEFYGTVFYDLQMYRYVFDYDRHTLKPVMAHPEFESRLYFIKSTSGICLEEVSKTRCYELMKEAERKNG